MVLESKLSFQFRVGCKWRKIYGFLPILDKVTFWFPFQVPESGAIVSDSRFSKLSTWRFPKTLNPEDEGTFLLDMPVVRDSHDGRTILEGMCRG